MRVWVLMFVSFRSKESSFIGVFDSELETLKVARRLESEFEDTYGDEIGYWEHYNTKINQVWF